MSVALEDSPRSALERLLAGRYIVERELGRGGMGAVYLARDARLDRPVAIKVLPSEYAAVPTLRERFLRESHLAAGFSHPNIVPVYAVEESADVLAYVMAFIEGETLTERVHRAGPLPVRETLRVVQDVAYALAFAHGRGVVHRDIKPDNVMIERATGRALVMDFGVARPIAAPRSSDDGLTRIGEIVGTPEYMSPEQATGDDVDGRSDLYSLGLVAHFALTATVAMSGDSTGRILARQLTEMPPSVRAARSDVPSAFGDAIDRCLAKDPAERFSDAASLIATLDAAQLGEPEIPVAIRLFAQSLGTLSLVVVFGAVFGYVLFRSELSGGSAILDAMLPLTLLAGVFAARGLEVLSEAKQLGLQGFSAEAVHRGLQMVAAERAVRRRELGADARLRAHRRRTIRVGAALVAAAPLMAFGAQRFRQQIGPHRYQTSLTGIVLIFAATVALPVGAIMLIRSPFRMPLGERLFRTVWLGPVGRWAIRRASRGMPAMTTGVTHSLTPVRAVPPAHVTMPREMISSSRIVALEERVAALERWRSSDTSSNSN